jgi:hypothetical protein
LPLVEPRTLALVDHVDPLDLDWQPILAFTSTLATHRGESPMVRNWKLIELATLLAVAAPSPALLAGETNTKEVDTKAILESVEAVKKELGTIKETLKKDFGAFSKDVRDIKQEITSLKADHLIVDEKVDKLTKALTALRAELDDLKKTNRTLAYPPAEKITLEDLNSRLTKIEQMLANLDLQQRTSGLRGQTANGTGRLKLVNRYPEQLLFQINGQDYVVQPQQTRIIDGFPAGAILYRVMYGNGWLEPRSSVVAANKTFELIAEVP